MRLRRLIVFGIVTELLYLSFYLPQDGVGDVWLLIGVNEAACLIFAWVVWKMRSEDAVPDNTRLCVTIAFAFLFRLTLVPHVPVASDDIYRYVWDGKVAASGLNPYALAPVNPALTSLHTADLPSKIGFPEMRTIYPPLAQVFFFISHVLFGDSVSGMKLLLLFFESCSILLLFLLLRDANLKPENILVYAWCPLPIMYFGLDGHIDALGIPFLLLFLLLMMRGKNIAGAIPLGMAGLAKLYPLFVAPFLVRAGSGKKRWIVAGIPIALLAAGCWLYIEPTGGLFESFAVFGRRFEFNGSAFAIIYSLLKSNEAAHLVCAILFVVWLGLVFVLDRSLSEKIFLAFLGFVIFSPVVQPWYLSWLAVLLVLRWSLAVFVLLGLSNLSNIVVYEYRTSGIWQDQPVLLIAEYLPFFGLLGWELVKGKFSLAEALIIFARLPRPGEVKTRLGQTLGMEQAAEVYRQFSEHAFTLANRLAGHDVRVYLFFDPLAEESEMRAWVKHRFRFFKQEGSDLGCRMRSAFDRTFHDGAARTVIIGTDVPELDEGTIGEAFCVLKTRDLVLGPSSDGGYYLLGMNAPTKDVFEGIVWSGPTVFTATVARIKRLGLSYNQLPELADIDTREDYMDFLNRQRKTQKSG